MQQNMRYVYEIYRQKSFSKAAEALFMTQPALSIAIAKLEADIGMPLFDRSTRPISLTPAGRIYLDAIEQERYLEQDLYQRLNDIRQLNTGEVTIGSSHYINASILPPVLTGFQQQFPNIQFHLSEGSSYLMAKQLKHREIDITFSCDDTIIKAFDSWPLFADTILLAVPQSFPVNRQYREQALTAEDIAACRHLTSDCPEVPLAGFYREPLIVLHEGNNLRQRVMDFFHQAGIEPIVKLELSQMATAYHLAEAGFAATFLSDHLITGLHSSLCFYRLAGMDSRRTFHVLTNPQRYLSQAVQQLIQYMRDTFTSTT